MDFLRAPDFQINLQLQAADSHFPFGLECLFIAILLGASSAEQNQETVCAEIYAVNMALIAACWQAYLPLRVKAYKNHCMSASSPEREAHHRRSPLSQVFQQVLKGRLNQKALELIRSI
jgi:hypothetical protein